jgi:MFS family permease
MSFEIPETVKVWSQFAHPILMWVLLVATLYAGYLGFQVRRTRNAAGDEKKELVKGRFNIRHYQLGSILLACMVLGSIVALAVTYINNGKLFMGPHLIAGLGMTGLIATSAALSPYMQKGHDWARYSHIGLNLVLVGLFAWQAVTGMQIVQNILNRMGS